MNFLALHDDVKFIIATHLASDLKIRALLSKNHDLQQILFGDVVYNDDKWVCVHTRERYNGNSSSRARCTSLCINFESGGYATVARDALISK
jgi:hypothetical protein